MFQEQRREYMKYKCNKFETNSTNKNIRDWYTGISEFKKSDQFGTNVT
jgi:hypothetical protein